jgi:excisionase family DNA binding protein
MLTVPEAAKRVGRDPETVRRWIRSGKLRSQKMGTQHLIDERDLSSLEDGADSLPLPKAWKETWTGEPPVDWVKIIRRSREGH